MTSHLPRLVDQAPPSVDCSTSVPGPIAKMVAWTGGSDKMDQIEINRKFVCHGLQGFNNVRLGLFGSKGYISDRGLITGGKAYRSCLDHQD